MTDLTEPDGTMPKRPTSRRVSLVRECSRFTSAVPDRKIWEEIARLNTQIEVPAVVMHSWNAPDPVELKPRGTITAAFLHGGTEEDLRSAARYVSCLPYARNPHPGHPLIVLSEKRRTCSTKHELIRRLAIEQDLDTALVLGMYEMAEQNSPGIVTVREDRWIVRTDFPQRRFWIAGV